MLRTSLADAVLSCLPYLASDQSRTRSALRSSKEATRPSSCPATGHTKSLSAQGRRLWEWKRPSVVIWQSPVVSGAPGNGLISCEAVTQARQHLRSRWQAAPSTRCNHMWSSATKHGWLAGPASRKATCAATCTTRLHQEHPRLRTATCHRLRLLSLRRLRGQYHHRRQRANAGRMAVPRGLWRTACG